MTLREFLKDNIKSFYHTNQLEMSMLCNYTQQVLNGEWHGKEKIERPLENNEWVGETFEIFDYKTSFMGNEPAEKLRFGDIIEVNLPFVETDPSSYDTDYQGGYYYAMYAHYGFHPTKQYDEVEPASGLPAQGVVHYNTEYKPRFLWQRNYIVSSEKDIVKKDLVKEWEKLINEKEVVVKVYRPKETTNIFEGNRITPDYPKPFDPDTPEPTDQWDFPNMELFRNEVRERRHKDVDRYEWEDNNETGIDEFITSSDGTERRITIPYADSNTNGYMTKEKFRQVDSNTLRIQSLETGGLYRGTFDFDILIPTHTPDDRFVGGEVLDNDYTTVRYYPYEPGVQIGFPAGVADGGFKQTYAELPSPADSNAYYVVADDLWYWAVDGAYQAQGQGITSHPGRFNASLYNKIYLPPDLTPLADILGSYPTYDAIVSAGLTDSGWALDEETSKWYDIQNGVVPPENEGQFGVNDADITWTFDFIDDNPVVPMTDKVEGTGKYDDYSIKVNAQHQLYFADPLNLADRLASIENYIFNWQPGETNPLPPGHKIATGNMNHYSRNGKAIKTHPDGNTPNEYPDDIWEA